MAKNDQSSLALINVRRRDDGHPHEQTLLSLLIEQATKGLDDVAAGSVTDARIAIEKIKNRLVSLEERTGLLDA